MPAKTRKRVITPVFRLSFPSIFEKARQMEGSQGEPKYEITMVFSPKTFSPEDKTRFADMKKMAEEASMDKFKKPMASVKKPNFRNPFRDGEEKEHLSGFGAGTVYVKASSKNRPGVVASDKVTPIEDAEAMYAGCYCRASVTCYAYDNRSAGVAFGLSNIMFVKDGDRLDSRSNPEDDFGELETADDMAD